MSRVNSSGDYNPWAVGLALFAGAVMMTVGLFQALEGLVALIDDDFYVVTDNYTFELDTTTWGWIHLIMGIVVAVSGYFVIRGDLWARALAMVLAGLAALANFLWVPYYPLWSLLIVALNILVIWALAVYNPRRA
ncbi:MAG: DUF7144 family membrane protein [Nocardioidaceae bacterium]